MSDRPRSVSIPEMGRGKYNVALIIEVPDINRVHLYCGGRDATLQNVEVAEFLRLLGGPIDRFGQRRPPLSAGSLRLGWGIRNSASEKALLVSGPGGEAMRFYSLKAVEQACPALMAMITTAPVPPRPPQPVAAPPAPDDAAPATIAPPRAPETPTLRPIAGTPAGVPIPPFPR